MGAGVRLPDLRASVWTIAASALLVGRITAAFALGQIAGPVVSALLLRIGPQGLASTLAVDAASPFATGAWLRRAA